MIEIKYRWTVEEWQKSYKYHQRSLVRRSLRWVSNGIAVIVVLLAIWSMTVADWSFSTVALFLAGNYWLWIRRFDKRWWLRRKFNKRPDKDQDICWVFSEDDIQCTSSSGDAHSNWSMVFKWLETPEGFFMYPNEDMFVWLPFDAFSNTQDIEALREIARIQVSATSLVG